MALRLRTLTLPPPLIWVIREVHPWAKQLMLQITLLHTSKELWTEIWSGVPNHSLHPLRCLFWNTNIINKPLIAFWVHTRCFCLLALAVEHEFVPDAWGACCVAEALLFCFPKYILKKKQVASFGLQLHAFTCPPSHQHLLSTEYSQPVEEVSLRILRMSAS